MGILYCISIHCYVWLYLWRYYSRKIMDFGFIWNLIFSPKKEETVFISINRIDYLSYHYRHSSPEAF